MARVPSRSSILGGVVAPSVLASFGLSAGAGCSFIFVDGPPPASAHAVQADCTTGRVIPIVDTVVAVTQGLRIAYAVGASDADYQSLSLKTTRRWDVVTGGALLGLFTTSAVVGYQRVSACRQAQAGERTEFVQRHGEDQIRELRRLRVEAREGGEARETDASPAAPAEKERWPEDAAIRAAFGRKVVRSCWLDPSRAAGSATACVQRGDFDGDGRPDAAVLVVETAEPRRRGIALLTSDAERALLGAGNALGNGGADFAWMDRWRVLRKADTTRLLSRAAGDGLVVEKAESAGGVVGIVDGRPRWAQWSD